MTTFTFKGRQYQCLEHMSEIKNTGCGELFKKYYNKKQMFKDFLGKSKRITDDGTTEFAIDPINGYDSPYESFGKVSGQVICTKYYYDYTIEFYRIEHIADYMIEDVESSIDWGDSFFVKDDAGQIWFVYVNND